VVFTSKKHHIQQLREERQAHLTRLGWQTLPLFSWHNDFKKTGVVKMDYNNMDIYLCLISAGQRNN